MALGRGPTLGGGYAPGRRSGDAVALTTYTATIRGIRCDGLDRFYATCRGVRRAGFSTFTAVVRGARGSLAEFTARIRGVRAGGLDSFMANLRGMSNIFGVNIQRIRGVHAGLSQRDQTIRGVHTFSSEFIMTMRGVHGFFGTWQIISRGVHAFFNQFNAMIRGKRRSANDSLNRWEVYIAQGRYPDPNIDSPVTFTSLPHTTAPGTLAAPGSGTWDYWVLTLKRNRWNLASFDVRDLRKITVNSSGVIVRAKPKQPHVFPLSSDASLTACGSIVRGDALGTVRVRSIYYPLADGADTANGFAVMVTTDGTDPIPGTTTQTNVAGTISSGNRILDWTSPVLTGGATAKVLITARRSSDGVLSPNTTPISIIVSSATGLAASLPILGNVAAQE